MDKQNYNKLKAFALEQGASLFGVADITPFKHEFRIREEVLRDLGRGICLGVGLSRKILEEIHDRPTRLYYHHYRQVNNLLDRLALKITAFIQEQGFEALPIPASQIIDWERQLGHLSHKHVAEKAGLGWIGRNNLLVNPQFGSQIRLVTILTNMPLLSDKPMEINCGECKYCLSVCPGGAIKEDRKTFDHEGCFAILRDFRKQGFTGQYICGICVKACKGGRQKGLDRRLGL